MLNGVDHLRAHPRPQPERVFPRMPKNGAEYAEELIRISPTA
jgi:hypothetical protein